MRVAWMTLAAGIAWSVCISDASAQSDDAVVVLYNGGVETVEVFDLSVTNTPQKLGDRRIVPDSVGPVQISDIKILPDGSHLLGNVDGRGAVVTNPTGETIRWELDPQRRLPSVDCATAASFFAPGEPSLVASGDSASSNVTIRSTSQNTTSWFDTLRLTTARGDVPQVIVMPGNRVATAVNWLTSGIYGIRISDTSDLLAEPKEILNTDHAEAATDLVVVPELDLIRDLVGLEDGRFLVTTRFAMILLNADGTLDELIDIGTLPAVSGELASVRVLESGLWAIATFQPGQWVQPNVNHRVHWFDPATATVVATSEPLRRAPLRVEAQAGTGATGTIGFDGGLDLIQQGDPELIEVASLAVPPTIARGQTLTVRATIQNTGTNPVGLSSVEVLAYAGDCGELSGDVALATANSVALNSMQQFTLSGETFVDDSFAFGPWCAFVQGRDQQGTVRVYGNSVSFEVIEQSSNTGSTIDVRPLPFDVETDVDMGGDADMGGPAVEPPGGEGCCATTAPRRAPRGLGLLFIGLLLGRVWARGRARR